MVTAVELWAERAVGVAMVAGATAAARALWSAVRGRSVGASRRWPATVEHEWVAVGPGSFRMGDPAAAPSDDYDEHAHTVTLTRPFRLSAVPTTVDQFAHFVAETRFVTDAERARRGQGWGPRGIQWKPGVTWRTASDGLPGDTPVVVVSWNDATAYCRWAAGRTGLAVRLPTEAEWEYACRAGATGPYNAPGGPTELGWFSTNSAGRPQPVGRLRPNAWGLYDMHGNVWQWCADAFGPYPDGPVTNPTGPAVADPRFRSARCASWSDPPSLGTSHNRGRWTPNVGYDHLGFRVAADLA
jgi:sulfatase modifying factor 1